MGFGVAPAVSVRKNDDPCVGCQPGLDFRAGPNIAIAVTNNPGGPEGPEVQVEISAAGVAGDYAGYFEQATLPTIVQIPAGKWGYWFDTVNTAMWLLRNRSDVLYGAEMTPM